MFDFDGLDNGFNCVLFDFILCRGEFGSDLAYILGFFIIGDLLYFSR